MTKQEFQKELLEEVKPGVKPSTIKKLKKSKSDSDLPNVLSQEVENLRDTNTELDNSLEARHKNLKDWWQQYQKSKELDQELKENINEATEELISKDETISQLRTENTKLKQTNQSLQKDLQLAQKLAEMRKYPLPDNSPNLDYLKYAFYSLLAIGFLWFLNKNTE